MPRLARQSYQVERKLDNLVALYIAFIPSVSFNIIKKMRQLRRRWREVGDILVLPYSERERGRGLDMQVEKVATADTQDESRQPTINIPPPPHTVH